MAKYENISITKDFYKAPEGFSGRIEALDPTEEYAGTSLENLDGYQRQLKRFDIKVSGGGSDAVEKFFRNSETATLFPEYVTRAVGQGVREYAILEDITASKTNINAMDYRSIVAESIPTDLSLAEVEEGGEIPATNIRLKDSLVQLKKRGRMMVASYEAIKFQTLDLFTVTLRQIGSYIARAKLADAVDVLMNGDGTTGSEADVMNTAAAGALTYDDLIELWSSFDEFEMNTMLVSPDMMKKLLAIEELRNPQTGLNFQGTGALSTPLGAKLYQSPAVPSGTIIGLDKNYALEQVTAGDVMVEYDKLIDCQLERAAVTSITGFSKICPGAVKVLSC